MPLTELLKIDGPGSIQDESLQLEVFDGTDWDLREITVGLTIERKPGENAEVAARARVIPAAEGIAPIAVERRSDVTLLYHLKAEAKPFSTTAFHENIGITPGPDEDWRWSIVEAKGIWPSQTAAGARLAAGPAVCYSVAVSAGRERSAACASRGGNSRQSSGRTSRVSTSPRAQRQLRSDKSLNHRGHRGPQERARVLCAPPG